MIKKQRYQLKQTVNRLELQDQQQKTHPIYVDFVGGKNQHRRRYGGGKGQLLSKAIGLKKYADSMVIDATAGLGREAFVLASLGCHVTLLERSVIVHALLADGLKRAKYSDDQEILAIINRMQLIHTDSQTYLNQLTTEEQPDVIYLDPMYPQREKSALVKKEMRCFHDIVGQDSDSEALLMLSREKVKRRTVLKRPRKADFLANHLPTYSLMGKSTRYDIYLSRLKSN